MKVSRFEGRKDAGLIKGQRTVLQTFNVDLGGFRDERQGDEEVVAHRPDGDVRRVLKEVALVAAAQRLDPEVGHPRKNLLRERIDRLGHLYLIGGESLKSNLIANLEKRFQHESKLHLFDLLSFSEYIV